MCHGADVRGLRSRGQALGTAWGIFGSRLQRELRSFEAFEICYCVRVLLTSIEAPSFRKTTCGSLNKQTAAVGANEMKADARCIILHPREGTT